jgi:hypothetical protein
VRLSSNLDEVISVSRLRDLLLVIEGNVVERLSRDLHLTSAFTGAGGFTGAILGGLGCTFDDEPPSLPRPKRPGQSEKRSSSK